MVLPLAKEYLNTSCSMASIFLLHPEAKEVMDAINENIEKKNVINYNYYKIGETGWYKLNNNFVTFIKKCNSFHDIYGRDAKNDEMIKIRKSIEQEKEIINKVKILIISHEFKKDNIPKSIIEIVQDLDE